MLKKSPIIKRICRQFVSRRKTQTQNEIDDLPTFHYKSSASDRSRVYVCGRSNTGALGNVVSKLPTSRTHRYVQYPKRTSFGEKYDVRDVACGYGFTVFTDGEHVFGTGINTDSQLGYHERKRNKPLEVLLYPAPIDFPEDFRVKKMSAGRAHVLILSDQGVIYTLGNNTYGQCGRMIIENEVHTGSCIKYKVPQSDFDNETVIDIKCGQDHSLALTESGRIFVCGWGADGQTSQGCTSNVDQFTPIKFADVTQQNTKFVKLGGKVDSIIALSDQGELYGWGCNEYAQLLANSDSENIYKALRLSNAMAALDAKAIDVDCGGSFAIALTEKKSVFVWGYGILGLGPDHIKKDTPTQIPNTLFGQNAYRQLHGVSSVKCGVSHMAAITTDGLLYTWGYNKFGCLGLGHAKDQYFPFRVCMAALASKVSCGLDHTVICSRPFLS